MEFPLAAFILCVSKKVLSKSVALQYSRLGRKGKKHFEHVEEVYNAILTAAALKFKEAGREELAEKFGRVLASPCAWEGSRLNKKTSECEENIDKLC
ncbi:hypothetical protein AVEN_22539-1 [Araneus ventricosus]|uniref:Uncharacterized protein n=1 Tax=Araneus ventricosus TaxID=182803 RepID=A0A4Y2MDL7_ARAVE|nr:hypothetical protein AVEN_38842-1 [Araneus ventricosus]GBO30597.1 hypothetical protein AVEN_22539-1 [Araneus ventricosus]